MIELAIHYLLARRRQTLLMLLGIFFGTASFIALSGLLLGFKNYLVDQLVNNSAHVHIEAREGRAFVEEPRAWYERLRQDPRVAAYSPQWVAPAVFSQGGSSASGQLLGCDPRQQETVTTLAAYVVEGKFSELEAGGRQLAIGIELKKSLGVQLSQQVMVA